MRAASDADPALFAGAVDIDIARRLTRLKAIELGLFAPLFFVLPMRHDKGRPHMRAASDADPALFAGAVDIDIARRLTRLKAIELGLFAPLFFDALGADALGRRPFLT